MTIEHYWQPDPDLASAVKGETQVGGAGYLRTMDLRAIDVLAAILVELRKMNIHLSVLSGQEVKDHDIEGTD